MLAVFLPLVPSLLLLIQYRLFSLCMFESRSFKRSGSFAVFLLLFSEEFSLLDLLYIVSHMPSISILRARC